MSHRDFAVGGNAVLAMSRAVDAADVVVVLLSRSYLEEQRYTTEEWTSALMHRADGSRRRVVPLRIDEVDAPALLRVLTAQDLFGIDPDRARPAVVSAVLGSGVAVAPPRPAEHWLRSVRGSPTSREFLFTGRDTVLADLARFAAGELPGLAVVTGMPGAGKSAVLGALVVRAAAADLLPQALRDRVPGIRHAAAAHASDRSAAEIVQEIAGAVGAPLGTDPRRALVEHLDGCDLAPVVVVDAVDEARDDVLPLLVDLAASARLILGIRSGSGGAIPAALRALHPDLVDLDATAYHSEDDVAVYVAGRLAADDRDDGYGRADRWPRRLLVSSVGREVGRAARRNFLVAQFMVEELLARSALDDVTPGWSEQLQWPSRVGDWMRRDLSRRLTGERARLADLLRPLAFADRGGLPADIWRATAGRFRGSEPISLAEQAEVVDVLGFFVAVTGERRPRFSLRHDAFAAYFRDGPLTAEYAAQMSAAVLDAVPTVDGRRCWEQAPDYVRWSLLAHLAESGDLDDLLAAEPACLAAVVAESAGPPLSTVTSPSARQAAGVFRRGSYAAGAGFAHRAAALQFHASLARVVWLARALDRDAGPLPWSAVWRGGGPAAAVPLGIPLSTWHVAAVRTADGRPALVVVFTDGSCAVLDAATAARIGPSLPVARSGPPAAVVAWNGTIGEVLVGVVDDDGVVRVWQATGQDAAVDPVLVVHRPQPVEHVVPLRGPGGADLVWIAAGDPGEVTLWAVGDRPGPARPLVDPEPFEGRFAVGVGDGVLTATLSGELRLWTYLADGRTSIDVVSAAGDEVWRLLAAGSAGDFCLLADRERALEIQWWPPDGSKAATYELDGGGRLVQAALAAHADDRLLATGDSRGTVQVWRLGRNVAPTECATFHVDGSIRAVELLGDGSLVAAATWDGRVRVHTVDVTAGAAATSVALVTHGEPLSHLIGLGAAADGQFLATRSLGGLTKLWQVAEVGQAGAVPETADPVRLLATAPRDDGTDVLAVVAEGREDVEIRFLDPMRPEHAAPVRLPRGEETFALAVAPLPGGRTLVCAVGDERLSAWELDHRGEQVDSWEAGTDDEPIEHLALIAGRRTYPVIARGGPEGLRIAELRAFAGRPGGERQIPSVGVTALSASRAAGDLIVVGTDEGTVFTISDLGDRPWPWLPADHGESVTHAFPLVHSGGRAVVLSIGRSGSVRLWDALHGVPSPRGGFQHVTEITHAAALHLDTRPLVACVDLTGALQVVDVLVEDGPRLVYRAPGAGGRASRLEVGRASDGRPTIAVAYSSGRLLLADPARTTSLVADLNCDLAALAFADRSGWYVGAYGAALVGLKSLGAATR